MKLFRWLGKTLSEPETQPRSPWVDSMLRQMELGQIRANKERLETERLDLRIRGRREKEFKPRKVISP